MNIAISKAFLNDFDDAPELNDTGILMKIVMFTAFPTDCDASPKLKDRPFYGISCLL